MTINQRYCITDIVYYLYLKNKRVVDRLKSKKLEYLIKTKADLDSAYTDQYRASEEETRLRFALDELNDERSELIIKKIR